MAHGIFRYPKSVAMNMAMRVPWELILLRPRNKAKVLEESVASLPLSSKATTGGTRAPYPLIEHPGSV